MLTIYDLETIPAERARNAGTATGRRRLLTEGLPGGRLTTRPILPQLPALLSPLFLTLREVKR
jgi:hypothetical protein